MKRKQFRVPIVQDELFRQVEVTIYRDDWGNTIKARAELVQRAALPKTELKEKESNGNATRGT